MHRLAGEDMGGMSADGGLASRSHTAHPSSRVPSRAPSRARTVRPATAASKASTPLPPTQPPRSAPAGSGTSNAGAGARVSLPRPVTAHPAHAHLLVVTRGRERATQDTIRLCGEIIKQAKNKYRTADERRRAVLREEHQLRQQRHQRFTQLAGQGFEQRRTGNVLQALALWESALAVAYELGLQFVESTLTSPVDGMAAAAGGATTRALTAPTTQRRAATALPVVNPKVAEHRPASSVRDLGQLGGSAGAGEAGTVGATAGTKREGGHPWRPTNGSVGPASALLQARQRGPGDELSQRLRRFPHAGLIAAGGGNSSGAQASALDGGTASARGTQGVARPRARRHMVCTGGAYAAAALLLLGETTARRMQGPGERHHAMRSIAFLQEAVALVEHLRVYRARAVIRAREHGKLAEPSQRGTQASARGSNAHGHDDDAARTSSRRQSVTGLPRTSLDASPSDRLASRRGTAKPADTRLAAEALVVASNASARTGAVPARIAAAWDVEIAMHADDSLFLAGAHRHLGAAFVLVGQLDRALFHHSVAAFNCRQAAKGMPSRAEGRAVGDMGRAFEALGLWQEALQCHGRHLRLSMACQAMSARAGSNAVALQDMSTAHVSLGSVLLGLGQAAKALSHYTSALELLDKANATASTAASRHIAQIRTAKAKRRVERALRRPGRSRPRTTAGVSRRARVTTFADEAEEESGSRAGAQSPESSGHDSGSSQAGQTSSSPQGHQGPAQGVTTLSKTWWYPCVVGDGQTPASLATLAAGIAGPGSSDAKWTPAMAVASLAAANSGLEQRKRALAGVGAARLAVRQYSDARKAFESLLALGRGTGDRSAIAKGSAGLARVLLSSVAQSELEDLVCGTGGARLLADRALRAALHGVSSSSLLQEAPDTATGLPLGRQAGLDDSLFATKRSPAHRAHGAMELRAASEALVAFAVAVCRGASADVTVDLDAVNSAGDDPDALAAVPGDAFPGTALQRLRVGGVPALVRFSGRPESLQLGSQHMPSPLTVRPNDDAGGPAVVDPAATVLPALSQTTSEACDEAERLYVRAYNMWSELGNNPAGLSAACIGLGDVALVHGDFAEAMEWYREAHAASRSPACRVLHAEGTALMRLAGGHVAHGNLPAAVKCIRVAMTVFKVSLHVSVVGSGACNQRKLLRRRLGTKLPLPKPTACTAAFSQLQPVLDSPRFKCWRRLRCSQRLSRQLV